MIKIETGQIWLIIDNDFWSSGESCSRQGNRKAKVNYRKGEYIEIRFQSPWHFRTVDNIYDCAEDNMFFEHCLLIGQIDEETRFANKEELKDIIEKRLFSLRQGGAG